MDGQDEKNLYDKVSKISHNLKNLYLDPNNYRFVDNSEYRKIDDASVIKDSIQNRTKVFIEGKNISNIKDLVESFKANGFLDVDIIQVRDLGSNNYLVLEGNRRVAALKHLQEQYEKDMDIGNLNPSIFKSIPFEIHANEDKSKHLIIMGLKHISGNKKWSAVNQSQLIYDYLLEFWGDKHLYYIKETNLCNSLGISKTMLRTSQRGYHLVLAYKQSEFGDQFISDMYSLFVEIVKKPNIRTWLNWDDTNYIARNYENLQRLFSWVSEIEELNNGFNELSSSEEDNDSINTLKEPIITKSHEIRDLALFINDENALNEMEKKGSVSRGLVLSGVIGKLEYESAMTQLSESILNMNRYKSAITLENISELEELKKVFENILPLKNSLNISIGNSAITFEFGKNDHFREITIKKYKLFNDFKIDRIKKINIFAGLNNSGKTSLLEAIYILTKQNDIASYLELIKFKNKLTEINSTWLNATFNEPINISGTFNNSSTSIEIFKFEANNIDKKEDYITSYQMNGAIEDKNINNTIHTFEYGDLIRENELVTHLCKSLFKSPYFYNLNEILLTYNTNVEYKIDNQTAINLVIDFMKEIDPQINDIILTEIGDIKRFIVDSDKFDDRNLNITNYGEGIQRIFEIALAFAYSKNGILCIDEFDTAIHYSLLIDFTRFIQILADKFNVQVFLSTHSGECINAFVENGYSNDNISAYNLENAIDTVRVKYIHGNRLEYLVDNIKLDIRGGKID
ncbi:AAA family ATPase [Clostridium tagluense]|uniref:AAA family ATPase n=1 Tax=Clostridium tagluense TaxID=360422 RepID=UPI001CF54CE2|nr:AAA family ATPase [Clostridium tagluense]MCB2300115.1 AAA family ATPase [Clostridium tagluense]